MKASDRVRPEPIPITDRSEIRGNHSYVIVQPAAPKPTRKQQEASHGEAV
jgi:hypothetical protein